MNPQLLTISMIFIVQAWGQDYYESTTPGVYATLAAPNTNANNGQCGAPPAIMSLIDKLSLPALLNDPEMNPVSALSFMGQKLKPLVEKLRPLEVLVKKTTAIKGSCSKQSAMDIFMGKKRKPCGGDALKEFSQLMTLLGGLTQFGQMEQLGAMAQLGQFGKFAQLLQKPNTE